MNFTYFNNFIANTFIYMLNLLLIYLQCKCLALFYPIRCDSKMIWTLFVIWGNRLLGAIITSCHLYVNCCILFVKTWYCQYAVRRTGTKVQAEPSLSVTWTVELAWDKIGMDYQFIDQNPFTFHNYSCHIWSMQFKVFPFQCFTGCDWIPYIWIKPIIEWLYSYRNYTIDGYICSYWI